MQGCTLFAFWCLSPADPGDWTSEYADASWVEPACFNFSLLCFLSLIADSEIQGKYTRKQLP